MKIGVLSDTHNNKEATRAALDVFREAGVEALLHCGDIGSSNIVVLFEGWRAYFVLGNTDRDAADLGIAARAVGLTPPQPQLSVTLAGSPIAMVHGHDDEALQSLIENQEHRYIFHGHTHRRRDEQIGKTRVINPGALGGRKPQSRSVAIIDLSVHTVQVVEFA